MKFLEYVENRELEAFAYKVHLLDECLETNNIKFDEFWINCGLPSLIEGVLLEQGMWDKFKNWMQGGKPGMASRKYGIDPSSATGSQIAGDDYGLAADPEQMSQAMSARDQQADPMAAMKAADQGDRINTGQSPAQSMQSAEAGFSPEKIQQVYQSVSRSAPQLKTAIAKAIRPMRNKAVRSDDKMTFAVANGLEQKLSSIIDNITKNPQKYFNIQRGKGEFSKARNTYNATQSGPRQQNLGFAG
jgi:hypothetical protein